MKLQRSNFVLGKGGSAVVYIGRIREIDEDGEQTESRVVAVKKKYLSHHQAEASCHCTSPNQPAQPAYEEEHELLATMSPHPHVIGLLAKSVTRQFCCFALELMSSDLHYELQHRKEALSEIQALSIVRDVASALQHVHGHHVAHRDVKTANILLKHDASSALGCRVVLSDFGVAQYATDVPRPGMVYRGTRFYQPPEVLLGRLMPQLACACDTWALGCLLLETILGHPPFVGEGAVQVLHSIFKNLGSSFVAWPNRVVGSNPSLFDNPRLKTLSGTTLDLIARLLHLDPVQRMTATEAVQHPALAHLRNCDPLILVGYPSPPVHFDQLTFCDVETADTDLSDLSLQLPLTFDKPVADGSRVTLANLRTNALFGAHCNTTFSAGKDCNRYLRTPGSGAKNINTAFIGSCPSSTRPSPGKRLLFDDSPTTSVGTRE